MKEDVKEMYWEPKHIGISHGYRLAARATFAAELLRHFAVVAAKDAGEDTAGRSKLALQAPEQLVERAFAIADAYFATAEKRMEIMPNELNDEQSMEYVGRMEGIKLNAHYKLPSPANEPGAVLRKMVDRDKVADTSEKK